MMTRRLPCLLVLSLSCHLGWGQEPLSQYREPFAKSWPIRERQHRQMKAYLDGLVPREAAISAEGFELNFDRIVAYEQSAAAARERLRELMAWPPIKAIRDPRPRFEFVGRDQHADIYRVWTELFEGVEAYAIYMVPRELDGKAPVIVAIHGGSGCPEAVCDFDTRVNYRSFGPEAVKRGYIVYAPGILMNVSYADPPDPRLPNADWQALGAQAEKLGIRTRDLQTYQIIEGAKAVIAARGEADGARIGVTGLSMGGGYTLSTTAMWPAVRAAACSAGFRGDREGEDPLDRLVLGDGSSRDSLVPLICPRPLMLQAGEQDVVVPLEAVRRGVPAARSYYVRLGIADRFEFDIHPDGHVFENDSIFRFFDEYLK